MYFSKTLTGLAVALPLATAQTFTNCNPLEKSCPKDIGLNAGSFTSDFTSGSGAAASWSMADGTTLNYGSQGAEFSISKEGQAPTIQTDFYIFFGRIDVKVKASPGTGIVSSIVLESDDLDEIDWEWLGGNTAQVETNFFGKGNTSSYDRAVYYPVSTPQNEFHTYTVDWNADRIEWIVDGTVVRTLGYNDPLTNGGKDYPQTPMILKIGNWCGGCSGEPQGTVQWAGGKTTFNDAPYVMYVESVDIVNYNPADSYEYSDNSGSWQSITINKDGSSSKPSSGAGSSAVSSAVPNNQTIAPTMSHPVSQVMNTNAAVSKTVTGSNYSMNTASISAENSGATGKHTNTVFATTHVPGSPQTTGGAAATSPGSDSGSASSSASGTAGVQTGSAATVAIGTCTSLLSLALGLLLL